MAGPVPEHVIQQVARGVDFVRLAGRYCDLKKKGKGYWALCPFHKEKSPSFSIDPEKGLYHCFGCKEGGSVFTFVQKMEGLSFGEALRRLAAQAGVDLSQYAAASGPSTGELARLRETNELATSFYHKCLQKAKGSQTARDYLAQREINAESIEQWRLGYAPDGWDHFLKCASGRGYEPQLLVTVGLALSRQEAAGHYDRFRNRLMFPIADATGRTIGFGARAVKAEDEPKYLNSPDTPLFSKGNCFFGLAQAKEAIRTTKTAVVLEGYTDVIMAHQCGIRQAIAVLGTALTQEHARTLSRLCERAILVFDADEAGLRSAMRSIEVLLNEDMEIRVASLPSGQDPCDYILAEGGKAFQKRLDKSEGFFEFRVAAARREHDTRTIEGKMAAFRDVAQMALVVRDAARRDIIVRRIAQELGIREESAWAYVRRNRTTATTTTTPGDDAARLSADRTLPAKLLGLLLEHPELIPEAAERLDVELMHDCLERKLVVKLLSGRRKGNADEVQRLLTSLADPALAAAASGALAQERIREQKMTGATVRKSFEDYLAYLERKSLTVTAPPGADDAELRALERKLRERDRRSAQSQ